MKLLVAHEFGHVLGLTDIYNNAEINRIYDINSNGDKTLYQYSLMICNEVPDNNIMRLKYNNDSYIVNLNNREMVLVAAYENRPRAYIHHLGDQLISNNGNVDYSKFVLSKAIREPIVVETCKTYGISTSSEQTYYLDKYSLELKPVVNN